jgi:hypothetical protein
MRKIIYTTIHYVCNTDCNDDRPKVPSFIHDTSPAENILRYTCKRRAYTLRISSKILTWAEFVYAIRFNNNNNNNIP